MNTYYSADLMLCALCDVVAKSLYCDDCDSREHCEYCGESDDCETVLEVM